MEDSELGFQIKCMVYLALWGIMIGVVLLMRRFKKSDDKVPPEIPEPLEKVLTPDELAELMNRYAESGEPWSVPEEHLPLHQSFIDFASKYKTVCLSSCEFEFDRSLMEKPYSENAQFLQIGTWCDDPILIRRNSDDFKVYGVWVDECGDPDAPDIYAYSLDEYFTRVWECELDSNERCKKQWFSKYGKKASKKTPLPIPEEKLRIHPSFMEAIRAYEIVSFKNPIAVFNRALMLEPVPQCPDYLKIGEWSDGGVILVRRDENDANVYMLTSGKTTPTAIAMNFNEYVVKAWQDHPDEQYIRRQWKKMGYKPTPKE